MRGMKEYGVLFVILNSFGFGVESNSMNLGMEDYIITPLPPPPQSFHFLQINPSSLFYSLIVCASDGECLLHIFMFNILHSFGEEQYCETKPT